MTKFTTEEIKTLHDELCSVLEICQSASLHQEIEAVADFLGTSRAHWYLMIGQGSKKHLPSNALNGYLKHVDGILQLVIKGETTQEKFIKAIGDMKEHFVADYNVASYGADVAMMEERIRSNIEGRVKMKDFILNTGIAINTYYSIRKGRGSVGADEKNVPRKWLLYSLFLTNLWAKKYGELPNSRENI